MSSVLDHIIEYKREEVAAAKANTPVSALETLARENARPRGFANALSNAAASSPSLIAEVKKASPSKGLIREDFDPAALARAYTDGGAACLSVLTDTPSFQGKPEFLRLAKETTSLPVLRKDFMIDTYQIIESRAWGADCILLIMACLSDLQARDLEDSAIECGMDVLIECHDKAELERALLLKSPLIGVNNRDLRTFDTRLETTIELAGMLPQERFLISESGIATPNDIKVLRGAGAKGFLVGESLMRQEDVTAATRALLSTISVHTA